MAVKPVRFISDIQTRKQLIKTDRYDNVLFVVSGSLNTGAVSSSLPITASGLNINGDAHINGDLYTKRLFVTEVTTSVVYETALSASINALYDVSASNANVNDILRWNGSNWIASQDNLSFINEKLAVLTSLTEQQTGNFDTDGFANIQLNNYVCADLDYIMVDVMVKESTSPVWKNDLISIELSGNIDLDKIHVIINAPQLTNLDFYRIITNKQTGSL